MVFWYWWWLVEGLCFEHGEEDIAAAGGDADDGGVVAFAFLDFSLVVDFGVGVMPDGDESRCEHSVFEAVVTATGFVGSGGTARLPVHRREVRSRRSACRHRRNDADRGFHPSTRTPVRGPKPYMLAMTFPSGCSMNTALISLASWARRSHRLLRSSASSLMVLPHVVSAVIRTPEQPRWHL